MGTELGKGYKINKEHVKASLETLHQKTKPVFCWKCGDNIVFAPDTHGNWCAHNPDKSPHWMSCTYSGFVHKKMALPIMKKLALVIIGKYSLDLETDFGLDKKELQVVHSALEKEMNQTPAFSPEVNGEVNDIIPFKPEPCDSIGDPDEERAPSEDLVMKVQEEFHQDHALDKSGVTQAITEMIACTEVKNGSDI